MTKAFANPRVFGAACLLFVGATIINFSANAEPSSTTGMGLHVSPAKVAEPVVKIGPTFPPSPWDDEPSVQAKNR